MARRFEWEKAKRRDRQRIAGLRESSRKAKGKQRLENSVRQQMLLAFVEKHSLECFACGTVAARWAKTGINKRGPWAICVPCVARRRSEKHDSQEEQRKREKHELIAENEALHRRQRVSRQAR
ncbi:MAG: hypothetical protein ACJ750_09810 [Gaiellaceae bacterium]